MKKVFSLLFIFLPLVSCQKENATPAPEADVAFVSIRNFETKSQIGTDAVLTWSENDRIADEIAVTTNIIRDENVS